MLLTSRPARSPFIHFDRVKFTSSYDPNPSIRLRSPANVVNFHSPPSEAESQATDPYDLQYRPIHPSPLRFVTNVPEQSLPGLRRQAKPGAPETAFPSAHQPSLSARKRVRFKGVDIIIPPLPTSFAPTPPTDSSTISSEDTSLTCSDHARVSPVFFDHETPATEEVPDSPSVYSPTPPNSSTPPTLDELEGSRGQPKLADGPPTEQSRGKDSSTSTSKGVSCDARKEEAPDSSRRDNSDDALTWWGRVTIAAGSVALSMSKAWEKAHIVAAKETNEMNKVGNHRQEVNAGQSSAH